MFIRRKPIVIAGSGLLSKDHILALESAGYKYILVASQKKRIGKDKKENIVFSPQRRRPQIYPERRQNKACCFHERQTGKKGCTESQKRPENSDYL
jgi:hypothetical protein